MPLHYRFGYYARSIAFRVASVLCDLDMKTLKDWQIHSECYVIEDMCYGLGIPYDRVFKMKCTYLVPI